MRERHPIRALILDFDGMILDTESCIYHSWRTIYEEHDQDLPWDRWTAVIGSGVRAFDPLRELEKRVGRPLDIDALQSRRRLHRDSILDRLESMPGVASLLEQAHADGLQLALASSSNLDWVDGHLRRLGLRHYFSEIATAEDVPIVKPAPDLYQNVIGRLNIAPPDAIAIEDSPNGVRSAKAAGLHCVAVPGPMTRSLSFAEADLVIDSLTETGLEELIRRILGSE